MEELYEGSCHCGAVRFSIRTDLSEPSRLFDCNCSRCRRLAAIMGSVPATAFTLHEGESALTPYRFNHHAIEHLFCRHCGVQPFSRGTNGEVEMVVFNLGCLENGPAIDRTAVTHFNGADY